MDWVKLEGDWYSNRKVGGSDLATLTGCNPHERQGALAVYKAKKGLSVRTPSSPIQQLGHELEPYAIRLLEGLCGLTFERFGDVCFARVAQPHHTTSPDGLGAEGETTGVVCGRPGVPAGLCGCEVKSTSTNRRHEWGPTGSEIVPQAAWVQAQWNMHVMGRDLWFVSVIFRENGEVRHYAVRRDGEAIDTLVRVADAFWQHVLDGNPPHPYQWGQAEWARPLKRGRVAWKAVALAAIAAMKGQADYSLRSALQMNQSCAGTPYEESARNALEVARVYSKHIENFCEGLIDDHRSTKPKEAA